MTRWDYKRKEPYTEVGIRHLSCIRCGRSAKFQWNICSDASYRPICERCDIGLNTAVLRYMRHPDIESTIRRYKRMKET